MPENVPALRAHRPSRAKVLLVLGAFAALSACQRAAESGKAGETEYCPLCGSPLALRLSRSAGLARYVMVWGTA